MKQAKMTTCRHCGAEIAANAKTCPHCGGKNKKPFYKKWWFWLIIVLIIIGAAASGGGSDKGADDAQKIGEVSQEPSVNNSSDDGSPDTSSSEPVTAADSESETPAEEVKTAYSVGDILKDGDMEIVYMSSGEYTSDNEFMQPAEGNKYIFIQLAFKNTSETKDASVSMYSFECYADGYNASMYYGGDEDLSATLSAGRSTSGYLYFEVPQDAENIEIEYEPNMLKNEKIKFVYEGEKDSGYVLEGNSTPTEGALHVGEKAESDNLNIVYLSCFADESDNMFITPKEGYHYVTCEFEFENVSSSDQTITYFSFDCYADGIDCDAAYFRDDAIDATMSSGRKAKGTVTFEVPNNAQVVEVEYLSNFWTSNRVVFTVEEQ